MLAPHSTATEIVVTASRAAGGAGRDARQRHRPRRRKRSSGSASRWSRPAAARALGRRSRPPGRAGSLTQVRIRGAEANHTLLFVDGIRANDPARATSRGSNCSMPISPRGSRSCAGRNRRSGDRRRSAGWSRSNGADRERTGYSAATEGGRSASSARSGRSRCAPDNGGHVRRPRMAARDGIDCFDGGGDKDGYRNLSGRLRGEPASSPRQVDFGASAFALSGRSEYDGFDPVTFLHADTLDRAATGWRPGGCGRDIGIEAQPWSGRLGGSCSTAPTATVSPARRSTARRRHAPTLGGQLEHGRDRRRCSIARSPRSSMSGRISMPATRSISAAPTRTAIAPHQLTTVGVAGGRSAGDRTDVAVRHDRFSPFADATTFRASCLRPAPGSRSTGSYGEGIAQPTFYDLYGFFPEVSSAIRP